MEGFGGDGMTDATTDTDAPTCKLGRPLTDCALRRVAGCETLHDVLTHLHPPWALLVELRSRGDLTPEVRAWLRRVELVTT